jgi:hypothetical protein
MTDLTILDAMKTRLAALTPPTGYAIRNVYATPPESLPVVPAIVLMPGEDSVSIGSGNRIVTLNVSVVLYLLPVPRMDEKYRDLYTWRSWLRDSFNGAVTISGNAAQVTVSGTTLGQDTYADQDYLTVTATAEVAVYEAVAYTA